MIDYVVVYAGTTAMERKIPMILKNKPRHLAGVLNLPGGKIEAGEDAITAAKRELLEETGLRSLGLSEEVVGVVYGHDSHIQVVKLSVPDVSLFQGFGETEPVDWYDVGNLQIHPDLMPNLRLVIPLIQSGHKGWQVVDNKSSFRVNHPSHKGRGLLVPNQ